MKVIETKRMVKKNTTACKIGKSLLFTAVMAICPMPGQAKTVSTSTEPVRKNVSPRVIPVSGWLNAFLNACF